MRLQLTFKDASDASPARVPIACQLHPGTEVASEITNIGEFRIDLGQALKLAMWDVWPDMPTLLTAKTGGSLDLKKVHALVQAAGLNTHRCDWRIADTKIAYTFNPACVIQVPKRAQLSVEARLHVEARKKIALVFYKNYFRVSEPMRYLLGKQPGASSDPDGLAGRGQVTLRRPGVQYADEKSMFSIRKSATSEALGIAVQDIYSVSSSPSNAGDPSIKDDSNRYPDVPILRSSTYGVIHVNEPSQHKPEPTPGWIVEGSSVVDELNRLASMLEKGLLTREEFDLLKAKIISGF